MARIRTLKPEIPGSAALALCSRDARLLFVWLITDADDVGRVAASAKRLAGSLYPHDEDVSGADVNRWLTELCDAGLVRSYWVSGARYIELVGWGEHQRINKPTPSRLPGPEKADPPPRELPHEAPEDSALSPTSPNGNVRELPQIPRWNSQPPPDSPDSPGPDLGAFGPRSTVQVQGPSFQTNVDLVGKSLVNARAPEGFAPGDRYEPRTVGASAADLIAALKARS